MSAKQPTIDANELKSIFEQEYNRSQWVRVLREIFAVSNLFASPKYLDIEDDKLGAKVYELGHFETKEGKLVGIYEVPIANKSVKLERNKVGLRNLLKKVYREDVDAAFIVFNQGQKWRFSYVSEIRVTDPVTKKRVHKKTDPKRYTYIMGVGERCKTAADRFSRIYKTEDLFEGGIELDTIEEAFSVERLSKSFFDGYKNLYGQFVAYLTGKDESGKQVYHPKHGFLKSIFKGDEKAARDFVKKMMGRIVFLYFLEKKGWLGVAADGNWGDGLENFMSDIFNDCVYQEDFYAQVLVPLFFDTLNSERTNDLFKIKSSVFKKGDYAKRKIPFLNGGLFDAEAEETQMLVFKKEHFKELFDFFDQYNFTVYEDSPEEHTVAVDPEMLGHIFENLLEDNKDKGAFYTPKEIVHYMCQESLIEYLHTKLNPEGGKRLVTREAIEKFIKHREAAEIVDYDEAILQALHDVKICDPAIGSGAFPMGLLHEIFYAVELLNDIAPDVTDKVWKLKKWDPAKIKLAIIENSIYGVDIEQGAVDIARLRFWLSLVVDEEKPQPLPNLDYKIVVGDSLLPKLRIDGQEEVIQINWELSEGQKGVGLKIHEEQKVKQILLKEKQHLYFNVKIGKNSLHKEIEGLKADILINQLTINKEQYSNKNPRRGGFAPTAKDVQFNSEREMELLKFDKLIGKLKELKSRKEDLCFFDWKFSFPEVMTKGVSRGEIGFDLVIGNPPYKIVFDEIVKEKLENEYNTFQRNNDLYVAFYEKGTKLLKNCGELTFITPNTFLNGDYFKKLRFFLKEAGYIQSVIDFKESKIFKEQTVFVSIVIFQKNSKVNYPYTFSLGISNDNFSNWTATNVNIDAPTADPIKAFNEIFSFVIKQSNIKLVDEILLVKDVGFNYWSIGKGKKRDGDSIGDRVLYKGPKLHDKDLPFIKGKDIAKWSIDIPSNFLRYNYQRFLTEGVDIFRYSEEILRTMPKLVYRQTSNKIIAALDCNRYLCDKTVHVVIPRTGITVNLGYILALFNSHLFNFLYKVISQETEGRTFAQVKTVYVKQFPIKMISKEKQDLIANIVAELSSIEKMSSKYRELEKKLNCIVCHVYNLTFDNAIAIENNEMWISKEDYEKYSFK